MDEKERENFNRNSVLIVEHTKEGLTDLIALNILRGGYGSFESFINAKQHEIYHLYDNRSRCCQCPKPYSLPKFRVLHSTQLDLLFDKTGPKKTRHIITRNAEFCCSFAHPGLTTSVLDATLARCLLVNFGQEVFWYSSLAAQKRSLEDFLTHNKHHIYHLYDVYRCCQCPFKYAFPTQKQMINFNQWKQLFSTPCFACPLHRIGPAGGTIASICSSSVTPGIQVSNLSPELSQTLLNQCCVLKDKIEELVQFRNNLFGHVKEARISDTDFEKYRKQIEGNLIMIAQVCNNEKEVQQKLNDLQKRTLDGTLLMQTIQEQLHTAEEIRTTIRQDSVRIENEITTKIEQEGSDIKNEIATKIVQESVSLKDEITTKMAQNSSDITKEITTKMAQEGSNMKEEITTKMAGEHSDIKDEISILYERIEKESSDIKEEITDIKDDIKTKMAQESVSIKEEITTKMTTNSSDIQKDITILYTRMEKESSDIKDDIKTKISQVSSDIQETILTRIESERKEITTQFLQESSDIKQHIDKKMTDMELKWQYTLDVVQEKVEEKRQKLIEKTEELITTHTDEKTFVQIRAVHAAFSCVMKNGIVVLIGSPGIGKSRIGIELLRQLSTNDDDNRSMLLDDVSQWQEMSKGMAAVFIDDIFGKTNCIYSGDDHSRLLDMMYSTAESGNVKLIISMRTDIYGIVAAAVESHRIFQGKHIVDLSSSEHQITIDEKKSFLMNYLLRNQIRETINPEEENINDESILDPASVVYLHTDTIQKILHAEIEPLIGFPEACHLFASHRKFTMQGHSFFSHPTEHLSNDIEKLMLEGDSNKKTSMLDFTLLVYILLNGESVDIHELDLNVFRAIMETIYLDPPSKFASSHIKISAKRLSGKYLKINNDGNYCFQHRMISEAVIISFSVADPIKVIPLLRFDFITEMARPQNYQPRKGEVIFHVPKKCHGLLAWRLLCLFVTDYARDLLPFIQNLCKSKIITMTSSAILQEIVAQYRFIMNYPSNTEIIHDPRLAGHPFYIANISDLYLPSTLMMFCNIYDSSVYKCLYDRIHNTLTSASEPKEREACIQSLVTAFNFAVCALDEKRATAILKVLKDHGIKQKELLFEFCLNITKGHGLHAVQLMYSIPDLCHVFDITVLLSEIFKSFTLYNTAFDEDMNKFINLIIDSCRNDETVVSAIVKYVCSHGTVDFLKDVCERFDSGVCLYEVDDMINVACKSRRVEVLKLLTEMHPRMYDSQKALEDACTDVFVDGVQVLLDKADHDLLDVSSLMNIACKGGSMILVKLFCKIFDSTRYNVREVMNHACLSGQIGLVDWVSRTFPQDLFNMKMAFNNACRSDDSEIAEWLLERFDKDLFDIKSALNIACKSRNIQMVIWLVDNFEKDVFNLKTAMNGACTREDNIGLVQWLFEKFDYKEFDMKAVMINACSNVMNAELVRWLCKTFDNNLFDMRVVMDFSGSGNQTEFEEWLSGDYIVYFY